MSTIDAALLPGYQLQLPTFEGPLDILLRLIERDQLAIAEISLAAVTDQFLAYVEQLGDAPPEVIAEFAVVAARLMLLKSRSLLPRPTATEEEPESGDLVRQLTTYRAFRDAARQLAARDELDAGAFASGGGIIVPEPTTVPPLAPHQPLSLARAIRRRLSSAGPRVQTIVSAPVITLREMVTRALELMSGRRQGRYDELLSTGADRHEVLTAFLAVLVLVRRGVFDAEQAVPFGEITLRPASATSFAFDLDGEAADD